jgi:hypothetical protein
MKKVLFLCTGNSCRSQMAEAIVNARFGDAWQAVSAGTKPAGYVHPKAIAALAEIGIQHEGRSSWPMNFGAWILTWWPPSAIQPLKIVPSGSDWERKCIIVFQTRPKRMT